MVAISAVNIFVLLKLMVAIISNLHVIFETNYGHYWGTWMMLKLIIAIIGNLYRIVEVDNGPHGRDKTQTLCEVEHTLKTQTLA